MSDSLLDDRPYRRMVSASPAKTPSRKIYLFSSVEFFQKRDRDMNPKKEISSLILDEVCERLDIHRIVCVREDDDDWIRESLKDYPLEQFLISKKSPIQGTSGLKIRLKELGVQFRPVQNPRQMTYLNFHKFVVNDDVLTCFLKDDYAKFGIDPDKEVTFQDLVQKRKREGWP